MSEDKVTKPTLPKEVQEGFDLINEFYGFNRDEEGQYNLKNEFREDIYRSIVFQFHLSIEELLKSAIYESLPKKRTLSKKQNVEYVQNLRSRQAVDLAARLGILNKTGYKDLLELNSIRNQCSHNWQLNSYKMRKATKGKAPKKRKYKIEFRGKNLLNLKVMKDEFIPLYSSIYLELFARRFTINWKNKFTN